VANYTKKEFMYECSMRSLQGSFANAREHMSVAAIVRESEKLWSELQEWQNLQEQDNAEDDPATLQN